MMRKLLCAWATACALLFVCAARAAAAEELTLRGRLAPTVEAGGWLVVTAREKYLLLNAERWRGESWFRADTEVEATGEPRPGTITIYQEGVPFAARTLRPVSGGQSEGAAQAVTAGDLRPARVVVTGDALVQAQPDTAVVSVAVVTQGPTALAAQQENARKSDLVVRAVKDAAGAGGEVKTSGYSLQPQYAYREGQPPTIRAYEARNSVTVTLSELNRVGAVIDAASNAGATNVDSLAFTLRQDRQARAQALAQATREALEKARAIAQALGGRVVRVVEVQETTQGRPVPIYKSDAISARAAVAQAPPTPVEVGNLDITSQVQLVAEVEIK
ncbi:MAG TPA: SIMPL domain-containing protein [Pyrinomonadaceae bacterium]|jgi:hypothetical protein